MSNQLRVSQCRGQVVCAPRGPVLVGPVREALGLELMRSNQPEAPGPVAKT